MTHEIRVPEPDDFDAFMRPVWRGFADPGPEPDTTEDDRRLWERERSLGVVDGDEWVGGTGAFTMDVTLPGGAVVPAAGVTMIGVAATHRRRGVLTALMARQLDDIAAGGEPIAMLTASESVIYGRFGFGVSTRGVERTVATGHARLRDDAPTAPGRCRQVTLDEARGLLPDAYDRLRATARAGSVRRWDAWWATYLYADWPSRRDGASALFVLVHEDERGEVDGWAAYRIRPSWPDRVPAGSLVVSDIEAVDDAIDEVARVLVPGGRFAFFLNHPLLQTPGSGWIDDQVMEPPEQYWRIGPYLEEDSTIEEVEKGVYIPFIHRPLSRYVNAMADAGLVLRRMVEPAPPPAFLARAAEYQAAASIPRLLVLVAEREAG